MSPHPALKPKTKEVLDKAIAMLSDGQYCCPQSLALALGHRLSGRISNQLKTLETLGYIRRTNYTAQHVEITLGPLAGPYVLSASLIHGNQTENDRGTRDGT